MKENKSPKILLIDIETAPIMAFCWGLWQNDVALNQIHRDWFILSWSAKWLDTPDKDIMYMDSRKSKNIEDDKALLQGVWKLLDKADVVIGQNSKSFDIKKLNARFIQQGFKPPSSYKQIDTLELAKKHFGFTSNKLEYLSDRLCSKYKKLKHEKFPGFAMWAECLKGNQEAWREMERYNKIDVLALQELYHKLEPWANTVNFNLYTEDVVNKCSCGSENMQKYGFAYTGTSKFQRYQCVKCGKETRGRVNLFLKDKQKSLRLGVNR